MTGCCATEVIYDLQETRRWLVDGHALTDLDGTGDRLSGRWRRDDDWTSELSAPVRQGLDQRPHFHRTGGLSNGS